MINNIPGSCYLWERSHMDTHSHPLPFCLPALVCHLPSHPSSKLGSRAGILPPPSHLIASYCWFFLPNMSWYLWFHLKGTVSSLEPSWETPLPTDSSPRTPRALTAMEDIVVRQKTEDEEWARALGFTQVFSKVAVGIDESTGSQPLPRQLMKVYNRYGKKTWGSS